MQGDIFKEWKSGKYEGLLIFGRQGFNVLSSTFSFYHEDLSSDVKLPTGESDAISGKEQKFSDGKSCLVYYENNGISDDDLKTILNGAYNFFERKGIKSILTNGVKSPGHGDAEAQSVRADYLIDYAASRPSIQTTFISLSDIFVTD
jgi:hypothetical protein